MFSAMFIRILEVWIVVLNLRIKNHLQGNILVLVKSE